MYNISKMSTSSSLNEIDPMKLQEYARHHDVTEYFSDSDHIPNCIGQYDRWAKTDILTHEGRKITVD